MKQILLILFTLGAGAMSAQHVSQDLLKPLDFLAGEWTVEANRRLAKDGPWDKSTGSSKFEKVVGQSIFQEDHTGTKQGRDFIVRTWLANDNRTKLYQRVSVDSDHGVLSLFEGNFSGDTLALFNQLKLPDQVIHLRHQYIIVSQDKFIFESARSTDGGRNWDMTSRLYYERVK